MKNGLKQTIHSKNYKMTISNMNLVPRKNKTQISIQYRKVDSQLSDPMEA